MRVITKITRQKNNPERYNIYLDEKYAFPVDEAILLKFELAKGKSLEPDDIAEINYEDEIRKAFNRALHYLSFQMRSEHEVKEKLLAAEFGEVVIIEAIQKLRDYGFLNDETYAKAFLQTKKATAKKGPRAIAQDLKRKGINEEMRTQVLNEYSEQEQVAIALKLAERMAHSEAKKTPSQVKQKIQNLLMRKGYNFTIIDEVMQQVELTRDEDDWQTMVVTQGDKLWQKYARKFEGYELRMRTKQALYQKGFPSEVIDAFIEDKENE